MIIIANHKKVKAINIYYKYNISNNRLFMIKNAFVKYSPGNYISTFQRTHQGSI